MHFHITGERMDPYGERIAIQVENQEGKRVFFSYYSIPPGDEEGEIEHEVTGFAHGVQPNEELKAHAYGFIRGPNNFRMPRKGTWDSATVSESGQVNFNFIIP